MEQDLSSYIEALAFFRNLCTHDNRIYDTKCKKMISDIPYHETLQISKNDIFAILIISKILLPLEGFNTMFNKISGRLTSLSRK